MISFGKPAGSPEASTDAAPVFLRHKFCRCILRCDSGVGIDDAPRLSVVILNRDSFEPISRLWTKRIGEEPFNFARPTHRGLGLAPGELPGLL